MVGSRPFSRERGPGAARAARPGTASQHIDAGPSRASPLWVGTQAWSLCLTTGSSPWVGSFPI
eukprot:6701187-Lingulodinium_polyedra.AAC.1